MGEDSFMDSLTQILAVGLLYLIGILAAVHVLLNKRDPRASLGWVIVCVGFPGIGVIGYILFGVNRVKTRGQDWKSSGIWDLDLHPQDKSQEPAEVPQEISESPVYREIKHVVDTVTDRPLLSGCKVMPLVNGEEAYPRMIEAINNAKASVYLVTFIFKNDQTGHRFFDALEAAVERGVDVRVIVDGIGNHYSLRTTSAELRKRGVPVEKFLPLSLAKGSLHLNLRNHRKVMVIDGSIGFTGGMNIHDRHCIEKPGNKKVVQDIHFQVTGPVVGQMQDAFLLDWFFCTNEKPEGPIVYDSKPKGQALCRGLTDGPDKDFEKIHLAIIGAFTAAQKHIRIMTPYFVPDTAMIATLNAAALKGIQVDIVLPEENNLNYVKWASQAFFGDLLIHGVNIHYQPAPFNHSKLLMIDDVYTMLGSTNMDARSLRLNFEFNLEVFDANFTKGLILHFEEMKAKSRQITLEEVENQPLWARLRDGFFKLFAPYL